MAFYGVYVPPRFEPSAVAAAAAAASNSDPDKNKMVFVKREEAFQVLKEHSDARVKGFATREDASRFAQFGQDLNNQSFNDSSKMPMLKSPSSALNPEKTAFRGPKIQELVEFRKAIESGNLTVVHAKIMENPRFLIGSGDTPAILKEGQRYNAMHVAALSKNPKMCELILSTIKPSYVQRFHGGRQTQEVSEEVAGKLLDLYLNTPEKGRFETPLHLSVKYGAADVVEVLTSYPQCKMVPNKEDQMPKDIICFRAPASTQEVKDRIAQLLEERFYVPVLRSTDSTVPPLIGEPFSTRLMPNLSGRGSSLTPELKVSAYAGPMDHEQAENFRRRWRTPPAVFNRSADRSHLNGSTSLLSVSLGAGLGLNTSSENMLLMRSPIRSQPRDSKRQIQRLLLSSPQPSAKRGENFVSTPKGKIATSALRSIDEFFHESSAGDPHGSNDSLNRLRGGPVVELSAKKSLFGNSPIKSPLLLLPNSQLREEEAESELDASYRERHLKLTDAEKGLEVIGRLLAKERNVGWNEYWSFLDHFANLTTPQGMQQLEQHFKNRQEQMERDSKRNSLDGQTHGTNTTTTKEEKLNISDICDRLNELHLNNSLKLQMNGDNNNNSNSNNHGCDQQQSATQLNAFLCVEKSCQVFAKRATKKILGTAGENASLLNGAFNAELGRLESLVCSYKDDQRFRRVDFQVVHSRFAHLVLTYLLEDERTYKAMLPKLKRSLATIRSAEVQAPGGEHAESVAEKAIKELRIFQSDNQQQAVKWTTSHTRCLAKFLMHYAENEEEKVKQQNGLNELVAEEDCHNVWVDEEPCGCVWAVGRGGGGQTTAAGQQVKSGHVQRLRDKNKKKRINDRIKRKIEMSQAEGNGENNHHGAMWEYRNKVPSLENEDDVIWADSNDSDHSLDSTDSDECFFYTPVESPTEFLTASDHSETDEEDGDEGVVRRPKKTKGGRRGAGKRQGPRLDLNSYRNYVLGDEPTKTDMDVFNAICDVEVDEATYPKIFKWQQAIKLHSMEEIQNFPSLSMIVRKSIPICKLEGGGAGSPLLAGRRWLGGGSSLPVSL